MTTKIDEEVKWDTDQVRLFIEQAKDNLGRILEKTITEKTAQATLDAENIIIKAREEADKLKDTSVKESSDIINKAHEEANKLKDISAKESSDGVCWGLWLKNTMFH